MRPILFLSLIFLLFGQVVHSQNTTACPNTPSPRLVIGQRGLTVPDFPHELRAEPSESAEIIETIPPNSLFEALEGPTCANNFIWWRIRYGDSEGWITEGQYYQYYLEPLTPITKDNLEQIEDIQLLGRGIFVTGAEWSSDGTAITVGSTVGVVQFNADDLEAPSTWFRPRLEGNTCAVEQSDDGSGRWGYAVCAEGHTEIRTYKNQPYNETWYGFDGEVHAFEFIKDSSRLAIASNNEVVLIGGGVDVYDIPWRAENRILALDVSANGAALAATDGQQVILVPTHAPAMGVFLDIGSGNPGSLALNFDGTLLAVGVGQQIQLWDVRTRKMLSAHDNRINDETAAKALDMKFSSDGARLVATTDGGALTVWDVGDSDIQQTDTLNLDGYLPMTHLALNQDGTQAALVKLDGLNNALFLKPFDALDLAAFTSGHTKPIREIAFSPDSQTLISVGEDDMVNAWNVASGVERPVLIGRDPAVGFRPDGTLLTATSLLNDNSQWWLQEWDTQLNLSRTIQQPDFFEKMAGRVFSPDGRWLASVIRDAENHSIKIWEVNNLLDSQTSDAIQPDFSLPVVDSRSSMNFSPDGRWFAYADFDGQQDGTITLLDTTSYLPMYTFKGHFNPIWNLTFSPDSKLLVSVSGTSGLDKIYQTPQTDFTARVWDVETGVEKFALPHTSSVRAVAFSADSMFFATGTENGDVHFWDSATGEKLHTLQSPYGAVNALAFSADGVWFAAATDTVVKIYRVPMMNYFGEG